MKIAFKTEPNRHKLEILKEIDCKCVEVYTSSHFLKKEYLDLLKEYNFEYSVHAPVKYCNDSVFEFASILEAKTVTVHCIYTDLELRELANLAKKKDIFLCIENEGIIEIDIPNRIIIHHADDYLKLDISNLFLTFDTEHSAMQGSTDSFWPLIESGYVKHMHTSGYDGTKGSCHSPPLNNPGRFVEIKNKLKNYEGFLTIEMHMKHQIKEVFLEHYSSEHNNLS